MVKQDSTLREGEGLQILSVYAHRASCGAPEIFRGEAPITLEQIAACREALSGAAPSPLAEAIDSATIFAQAILAPMAVRRQLRQVVNHWRAGVAFEALGEFLGRKPKPGKISEWSVEFATRVEHCQAVLSAVPGDPEGKNARQYRTLLRDVAAHYQPLQAWEQLPAAADVFLRKGRPGDATRLRELLEPLTKSLSPRRQRLFETLDRDLSRCDRPGPTLGELQRALQLLGELLKGSRCGPALPKWVREALAEIDKADRLFGAVEEIAWREELDEILRRIVRLARPLAASASPGSALRQAAHVLNRYLSRKTTMTRIRANISRLLEGRPPRISSSERLRLKSELAAAARRWLQDGARATADQLRAMPPISQSKGGATRSLLRALERFSAGGDPCAGYREADQIAAQLAASASHCPSGETLKFLLVSCEAVQAALAPSAGAAAPGPLQKAAARLEQFLTWTIALADFIQQRRAALDGDQPAALTGFLAGRRFSIRPPEELTNHDLLAWLLAIPAPEREAVLEFLQLGPVRAEILHAALSIAQVESAVRRHPRLSPEQFADCIAGLEESPTELSEILVRELVAPRLSGSEQQRFTLRLKLLRRQRQRCAGRNPARRVRGSLASDGAAPFFASPFAYGVRLERSRRKAALELSHSLWRAGVLSESHYRGLLGQFWRRPDALANKWDRDRRRSSLVEQMIRFADQMHAAAVNAGHASPSLAVLVWGVWSYLKADEEIAARWREHVPSGQRRENRTHAPARIEAGEPGEIIDHIRVSLMKWFDLTEVIARAGTNPAAIDDADFGDARAVDLLLFDWFGEAGMLLPATVYAAPLATAVRQALEVLQPLAPHDAAVERVCRTLAVLAPFYAQYQGWAAPLAFGGRGPAETIARWRDLLLEVRSTARRLSRARTLAGAFLPAWQAAAELLSNQQQLLRLQLAVRVAVERDEPACRYLCASRSLLAQLDAARVGLARRRRFHLRSEAKIIAAKLSGRVQTLRMLPIPQPWLQADATALAGDCQTLLALHAAPPNVARRKSALACADRIDQRAKEMCSMLHAMNPAARRREDERVADAANLAAQTARDLTDGFFAAKQHKGLRTLIPLRHGDRLDDTLDRV